MKRIIALLLSIVLIVSSALTYASAASSKKVKCATLNQASDFIFDGGSGEITVAPVKITENGKTRNAYIVCVMGMGYNFSKPNNPLACIPAAFNMETKYYKLVRSTILKYVPKNSELLLYGHSLGGMTLQKIACDSQVKEVYNITKILTIGSPYIMVPKDDREGKLVRFADTSDMVPKLSPAIIFSNKDYKDAYFEDGGYNGNPDTAHNRSYRDADVWKKYDALGVKGGKAYFTYLPDDVIGVAS